MVETAHLDTFARDNLPPPEEQPLFLFDRPELRYPERLNCVTAFLDRWVEEGFGDDPCLISPERTLTYRELQGEVNRIANLLTRDLGLVPGGRVLLRSANNPTMVAAYLAVLKAGGIVVATMPLLRAREIAYPLEKARVAIALCDQRLSEEMEKARPLAPSLQHVVYWGSGAPDSFEARVAAASDRFEAVPTAADDICLIGFTSGTTGQPKGTMHAHRDMLAVCDAYSAHILRPERSDRFIGSPPLAFTFGLGGLVLFPLRVGASTVLLERTSPEELLAGIQRFKATICFTAPTAYRAMLPKLKDYDIASLKKGVSAGEPLPKATFDAFEAATGIRLLDGIGATEMLHIFIAAPPEKLRPGATGLPVPGYEACLLDPEGRVLPRGSTGRLAVRGPTGCRYLADERQRAYVQHGWNVTGDTYRLDEDGYFWFEARSDDMIVSAGYNIAGPEVEAALLTHPAVAECGVVGAPDPERGMIVKAYIVPRPGHAPGPELVRTLQEHVKAEIAPYKYPRAVVFVEELPKTQTGKLQRFALRERARGESGAASPPSTSPVAA
jgi:2-aminobenzoate-CoA ligase